MMSTINHEGRMHAGLVMREMVNPLEAANNIAYLLSVSTDDPASVDRYVEMLQGQLAILNRIALRTLEEAKQE